MSSGAPMAVMPLMALVTLMSGPQCITN